LKHSTAWTPTDASTDKPPGWTSPTGRHYQSEHHDREAPHWPPQILDQIRHQEISPASPEDMRPREPAPSSVPGLGVVPAR
ncbi:MAG TPA: HNH endonuclease, partial [Arthrobacter sp.]|nr:HNH endonuclease [Arthrobacter sp.]